MKFLRSRPYADQRAELMEKISPRQFFPGLGRFHVCHHCGARKRSHLGMEFDHLGLRLWDLRRQHKLQRLRLYLRDWLGAGGQVGLGVVGACSSCNRRRGGQRGGNGRAVYTAGTPHGRLRARRGRGYTAGIAAFYAAQEAA